MKKSSKVILIIVLILIVMAIGVGGYFVGLKIKESNEKINELAKKGAKQTAVLVVRSDLIYTNDYEGYYNVDSVKKLTRNR